MADGHSCPCREPAVNGVRSPGRVLRTYLWTGRNQWTTARPGPAAATRVVQLGREQFVEGAPCRVVQVLAAAGRRRGCPGWRCPGPADRRRRTCAAGPRPWRPGRPAPGPGSARAPPPGPDPVRSGPSPRWRRPRGPRNRAAPVDTRGSHRRPPRAIRRATESAPPTCWTEAPSGLEVSARTNTPAAGLGREVQGRPQRLEAQVRAQRHRIRGQRRAVPQPGVRVGGHGGADVAALGVRDGQHRRLPPPRPGCVPARPSRRSRGARTAPPAVSPRQRGSPRPPGRSARSVPARRRRRSGPSAAAAPGADRCRRTAGRGPPWPGPAGSRRTPGRPDQRCRLRHAAQLLPARRFLRGASARRAPAGS